MVAQLDFSKNKFGYNPYKIYILISETNKIVNLTASNRALKQAKHVKLSNIIT